MICKKNNNLQKTFTAALQLELQLPRYNGNIILAEERDPGYGKNVEDWVIRNQAPNLVIARVWRRLRDLMGVGRK